MRAAEIDAIRAAMAAAFEKMDIEIACAAALADQFGERLRRLRQYRERIGTEAAAIDHALKDATEARVKQVDEALAETQAHA